MKKFLKKHSPSREQLNRYKVLKWLNKLAHDKPGIWGYNRSSVAPAFAIGLFWAMIPIPMQMFAAAYCAYRYSCNIPLAVALVWTSNPLTIVPLVYYEYSLGSYLLNIPLSNTDVEWNTQYLLNSISEIWPPLFLGAFIFALTSAILGFVIVSYLWILQVKLYQVGKKNQRNKQP